MRSQQAFESSFARRLAEARVGRIVTSDTPANAARPVRRSDAFVTDRHAQREMLYVLEGRSKFMYRDRVWDLAPGSLVAIDAWETHALGYRAADNGLLHLWLCLNPDRMTCSLLEVDKGRHRCAAHLGALAGTAFAYLSRQWAEAASGGLEPPLRAALLAGVAESAMRSLALETCKAKGRADAPRGLAEFVADYIARQHGRDCSLGRLERVTGYSRFYLSRLFRGRMGMTIGEAVAEARRRFLAEAQAQGLKQGAISEALGFSSPSAFCLWKRRIGARRPVPAPQGRRNGAE